MRVVGGKPPPNVKLMLLSKGLAQLHEPPLYSAVAASQSSERVIGSSVGMLIV